MSLQVVGAGLGRTGTLSLKQALEQLLGARCYHMLETRTRPDDIGVWEAAVHGEPPDWNEFLSDFAATVDWPACAFWRELADANPDALVLLSVRDSADAWWNSADATIFHALRRHERDDEWPVDLIAARFTAAWRDEQTAKSAYERHNHDVRAAVPPERLLVWNAHEGWEPICAALGLPVPREQFPRVNTTEEFQSRFLGAAE